MVFTQKFGYDVILESTFYCAAAPLDQTEHENVNYVR